MSRFMATFTNLQQFLQTVKPAFASANRTKRPVKLVLGNESADLDSFASSIIYAYLYSIVSSPDIPARELAFSPTAKQDIFWARTVPSLPVLNIPRSDFALRPEHQHLLANHLSFAASDVPTQDDILVQLPPDVTVTLVDHNVLQPPLSIAYGNHVTAIIDHHDDEGKHEDAAPRLIMPAGSCTSLVLNYFRSHYPTHWNTIPGEIHSEIARLALAPILIDTANLTSKTTTIDVVQVTELLERAGAGFDRHAFYKGLRDAKSDLSGMTVEEVFRKDYKQWREKNGIILGVSSVTRSLAWVVKKAGGMAEFTKTLEDYAKTRGIDVAVVMTTEYSGETFRRDLLIWGADQRTMGFAQQFEDAMNERFKLEKWPAEQDELEVEITQPGMKAWTQASLDLSRKQVAPALRSILSTI